MGELTLIKDISGNDDTGVAYIIQDTGEGYWEVRKRILSNDLQAGDEFGFSVGLSGRYAIVGISSESERFESDIFIAKLFPFSV